MRIPIEPYRARLYRLVLVVGAIYNVAFGLWAALWPLSLFQLLEMNPPSYPGIWRCLGMIVGLYGLLYAYAGVRLEAGRPIVAIGLAGKILGPIGWLVLVRSGEWPTRSLVLLTFNNLIWWLPFVLFLLEGTRPGVALRNAAPWVCAAFNALASAALLVLRAGTEAVSSVALRASYIREHGAVWRAGWAVWMAAALSLVAFYAWWGALLPSRRWSMAALGVAATGLVCDLFAESLLIGWPPERIGVVGPVASLLTGGAANGLYSVAGGLLTLRTPFLTGHLRTWAWATWASGLSLTAFTLFHSVHGMIVSTIVLMSLFCPWVVAFGMRTRCSGLANAVSR